MWVKSSCGTGGVNLRAVSRIVTLSPSISHPHTSTQKHTHPHIPIRSYYTRVRVCERTCVAFSSRRNRLLEGGGRLANRWNSRFTIAFHPPAPSMSCAARRHHHPSPTRHPPPTAPNSYKLYTHTATLQGAALSVELLSYTIR